MSGLVDGRPGITAERLALPSLNRRGAHEPCYLRSKDSMALARALNLEARYGAPRVPLSRGGGAVRERRRRAGGRRTPAGQRPSSELSPHPPSSELSRILAELSCRGERI